MVVVLGGENKWRKVSRVLQDPISCGRAQTRHCVQVGGLDAVVQFELVNHGTVETISIGWNLARQIVST
jgi:hypothetical protein